MIFKVLYAETTWNNCYEISINHCDGNSHYVLGFVNDFLVSGEGYLASFLGSIISHLFQNYESTGYPLNIWFLFLGDSVVALVKYEHDSENLNYAKSKLSLP